MEKNYPMGPINTRSSLLDSDSVADRKESEIVNVLSKLQSKVDIIKEIFNTLNARLSPVLRKGDAVSVEKPISPEYSTGLAQEINNSVRDLSKVIDFIDETSNRLEL